MVLEKLYIQMQNDEMEHLSYTIHKKSTQK